MAKRFWLGTRQPSAQIEAITFTSVGGTGETVTLTVGNKSITYTRISGETTTTLAAAVAALWGESTFGELREITATSDAAVLTLTGSETGQPFTLTITDSGGGSPITWTRATTAATSPNHVSDAANYDGGTLPSGTDEIVCGPGTPDIKYGLTQFASTAVTITRLSGGPRIGLPNTNEIGGYAEYRQKRLRIQGVSSRIETGTNEPGAVRIEFTGTTAATVTILGVGDSGIGGEPVELWDLPNNSAVNVNGSGVRVLDEDSVAVTGVTVNAQNSSVIAASRATLAAISLYNANAIVRGEVTGQLLLDGGAVDVHGSVNTSTGSTVIDSGQINWIGNANVVNAKIGSGGVLSLAAGVGAVSVTGNIERHEGGRFLDPNSRISTYTIDLIRSGVSDELNIGTHRRITVEAIS